MLDVTRDEVLKRVYRRLTDPKFASRLTVCDENGERPIVVATASDTIRTVLSEVAAIGGQANVVVAILDGMVTLAVDTRKRTNRRAPAKTPDTLADTCAMGVFVARVIQDGGGEQVYRIAGQTARTHDASLVGAA